MVWGLFHGFFMIIERIIGKRWQTSWTKPFAHFYALLVVIFGWVFFRAADLPSAFRYLGAMLGVVTPAPTAALLSGLVYQPYYLMSVAAATLIAFAAPQTWEWTRSLPAWKVLLSVALLWASLTMLETQAYNPFIYFIF